MCLKLDLRKAFDSLNRQFLCSALRCFGFHENWIGWIQECMNPTFSLLINGECTARFDSSTGIRQGDPLSPYLFVIAMQVLSALLKKAESNHELDPFSCGPLSVSHVIFADDPMIFLHADKKNACHLKHLLDDFTALSKLRINFNKSAVYFGGPVKHRQWIVSHLGLNQEELLVRYLGLLLLSKRLSATSCAPLQQAITTRLQSWKAKLLSYAGRVELIKSALSSMHLYWTSVFILPVSVLQAIDRIMLHFLWDGHGLRRCIFTSWNDVCRPKEEGGLGI